MLSLVDCGLNNCAISRATGIPRSTLREWRIRGARSNSSQTNRCFICEGRYSELPSRDYAYLLGQYLGDGHIATTRKGVFVLRVFSFSGYPEIVAECGKSMRSLMPASKVSFNPVPGVRLIIVTSYSKHWPCLFPQHGPGRKHERPIRLAQWQAEIVQDHREAFLRGLVHSDGCRAINKVKTYKYPRYFFSNASDEIRQLFTDSCDRLGIAWRRSNERVISIARREAVAEMDTFIGPKR